jgi:hypothetical protein
MATLNGNSDDNTLIGTGDDDQISGEAGDDLIRGRGGDDEIDGGSGDDVIFGGRGDDEIDGGSGDDVIVAGRGDDVVDGGSGDDVILAGRGDDEVDGGSGDDVIKAGSGDDVVDGGSGDDEIEAGSGDDEVDGGSGDDVIKAGSGDDEIDGGSGDDVIKAGSGDDEIVGGRGDDVMSGGSGEDTYRFAGNFGDDLIKDFDKDEDLLDLSAFDTYELEQDGNDTIVIVDGGTIRLKNVSPDGLEDAINIPCVVRGTLVRTPAGEVPVETLAAGDEVITIDGTARRVKWIGRRSYGGPFLRRNPKVAPIRIAAGAMGEAMPATDLLVSPEHAIYIDGALIPAKLLVNGDTVRQVPGVESVEYFHIEVDGPDVLWTNGAPTESYVNHGNRRMFRNWRDYVAAHGAEDEAPRAADGQYVRRFPPVYGGAALQAARAKLAGRTTLTKAA